MWVSGGSRRVSKGKGYEKNFEGLVKASVEARSTKSIKGSNDGRQRGKAGITERQSHKC